MTVRHCPDCHGPTGHAAGGQVTLRDGLVLNLPDVPQCLNCLNDFVTQEIQRDRCTLPKRYHPLLQSALADQSHSPLSKGRHRGVEGERRGVTRRREEPQLCLFE